ncbi:MAG: gliding motility protein GldM [Bacteroidales bacterium]
MGHGKETPRQKMIGMMYLVLTAMLAMNVSAEVLDAFRLVNEGIKKTTGNFMEKNESIYKDFEQEVAKNEQKAGRWKQQADSVRELSQELYDYMQDMKVEIIKEHQGENIEENAALFEEDGMIKVDHAKVQGEDKWDVTTRLLIGENKNGRAYELKELIEEYREELVSMIDEKNQNFIETIQASLNTDDPPPTGGREQKSWEIKHFNDIPVGAVLPILSTMQADIRNAESEMIRYLFNQIEAGAFTFNKLEPTVIANSGFVFQGNDYKADVFLAARDTTMPPTILIGEWDSIPQEDGSYDVVMQNVQDTLDVVGGKGKYQQKATSTGKHEWGGIIMLRGPAGDTIKKPFRQEYRVEPPNLVISPTKMNVFYVGIPNPVSISVPGVPSENLKPSISNGTLRKVGSGNYEVSPRDASQECVINVNAEVDGEIQSFGSKNFRVQRLPTPVPQVAGKSGGDIEGEILTAQSAVFAEMEDFLFDLEYKVTQYTITTTDRGGYVQDIDKEGSRIDSEVREWLRNNAAKGRKVTFEDIVAVGPDGEEKRLNPITFTIQ